MRQRSPLSKLLADYLALVCGGLLFLLSVAAAGGETIATCGKGWLERIDGQYVLHVKGSPYEMGYQHGALLKDHCRENMNYLLYEKGKEFLQLGPLTLSPRPLINGIVEIQRKHIPQKYFDEIAGLAAGAGLSEQDLLAGNFIPEMFHCSGFAVMNSATADGTLYHGRVLDYACDWRLQEHAVIVVAEPDGGIPFVNVTYAGFVGSVTGMNVRHVSIGEMGGRGLGQWDGVPMALLMREVLETANTLDEAIDVFKDNPRTCEYYYVIADGKTNRAVGMEATWKQLNVVKAGEFHPRLPHPVDDAVLLSADKRYDELVSRVKQQHGRLDATSSRQLMDRPVAMRSNLHNVLFAPRSTQFWVAHATPDGQPAAGQPYHEFQLTKLLERRPDATAVSIAFLPRATGNLETARSTKDGTSNENLQTK